MIAYRFSLITLLVISFTSSVFAVGVDLNGYFRTRYNFNYNQDLDRKLKPNARNYADFRFRLDPTFFVTEKIRIKSSFNVMDGAVGNTNFRGIAYDNPASNNNALLNNTTSTGSGAQVGKPMLDSEMDSWVYGGAYAPDAAMQTAGVGPVQLRRAWLEYETPYGILKAGRMPFHLGIGIFANAGDGVDQEIGTTRDRLAFETTFGSYYLIPSLSWVYEGLLDRGADDVYEFGFQMGRKIDDNDLGLYISYLGQARSADASTNGSLAGSPTKMWMIDFYGKNRFGLLEVSGEVNLFTGKYIGRDLLAINAAVRTDWLLNTNFNVLVEGGYSSGTNASDVANRDLKTIAFNRDYNISYILFEEAIPGGINRAGRAPYAPHSGALSNAIYARLYSQYRWVSWYHPAIQILSALAAKNVGTGGKFYGIEYDLINEFPLGEYVSTNLVLAALQPGSFYSSVSKKHFSFLSKAGLNVKF